jgi:hypothetical protein
MSKLRKADKGFECCLLLILLATVVDVFWSIQTGPTLLEFEKNPLAVYIIKWGNSHHINGIALLCALKIFNTYLVIRLCQWLRKVRVRWGWSVTLGVTAFQLFVVWYLYYGSDQG